ncbi:hypothetical protein ACP70R_020454 [Stipagrostis hirtigluma subsp. patula]
MMTRTVLYNGTASLSSWPINRRPSRLQHFTSQATRAPQPFFLTYTICLKRPTANLLKRSRSRSIVCRSGQGTMDINNLYLDTLCKLQENERLRRRVQQLDQENKALLAQIQLKQQRAGSSSGAAQPQQGAPSGGAGDPAAAAGLDLNGVQARGKQAK